MSQILPMKKMIPHSNHIIKNKDLLQIGKAKKINH